MPLTYARDSPGPHLGVVAVSAVPDTFLSLSIGFSPLLSDPTITAMTQDYFPALWVELGVLTQ